MIRTIIVAYDKDRVIGVDGSIPWHVPEDFKHFKKTTLGHPIIMGRKTYESIGKPLSNRWNIVLTRKLFFKKNNPTTENMTVVLSLQKAIKLLKAEPNLGIGDKFFFYDRDKQDEVFIIGGSQVYKDALDNNLVDKIIATEFPWSWKEQNNKEYKTEVYFPKLSEDWKETKRTKHPKFDIVEYIKK